MKTSLSLSDIEAGLFSLGKQPEGLAQLDEGQVAQAFKFMSGGSSYVLRISQTERDFLADKFISKNFSNSLPVPHVYEIGAFTVNTFYCISEYKLGNTVKSINDSELARNLPEIQDTLAAIFLTDITEYSGYGGPNFETGNAPFVSWRNAISSLLEKNSQDLRKNAVNIDLDPVIVDKFLKQYEKYLPYASEQRYLLHGDPGFDNMIIKDGKIVAVIDWAQFGYGDWMSDFARISFWRDGGYGEPDEFAKKFDLSNKHLEQRQKLYWAINALLAIEFADKAKNESVKKWLHENAISRQLI